MISPKFPCEAVVEHPPWSAEANDRLELSRFAVVANRIDLYQPILRLGCIRIERGKPAAIIAPWHPLRLAAIAIKARQLAGLLRYIISTPEVGSPTEVMICYRREQSTKLHQYGSLMTWKTTRFCGLSERHVGAKSY